MNDQHPNALHAETLAVGHAYEPLAMRGSVKPPLFLSSTFQLRSAEEGERAFQALFEGRAPESEGGETQMVYSRLSNPNLEIFEARLAALDGTERGAAFATGMAAVSTTLLALLQPGDHIIATAPVYGGTYHLLTEVLRRFGIQTAFVPSGTDTPAAIREAAARIRGDRLRMIYVETPANPTNALVDIDAVAHLADRLSYNRTRRVLTAVDNTLLGPVFQRPAELGADLVIYSATKFIGGHSDLLAGAVTGPASLLGPVLQMRALLGTPVDAFTAWLLLRSLETVHVRMRRQAATASRLAKLLESHPSVARVHHLALLDPRNAQHEIKRRQCSGEGALIAFEVHGGKSAAFEVLNSLEVAHIAVSLGGTETLVQHPHSMTHGGIQQETLAQLGITPGLIRMSVGLEHPEDLERDLLRALDAARPLAEEREDARTTDVIHVPLV